jgi:thiol:disulfide interchange protein
MLRFALAALLVMTAALASGAEKLAEFVKNDVAVTIAIERGEGRTATIVGVFTPDAPDLHLYGLALPPGGVGVATRIDLPADAPLAATGELTADEKTHDLDGLPVFPEGPVTLRLSVLLPVSTDGEPVATTLKISYLACTTTTCRIPFKKTVDVRIPTVREGATAQPTATPTPTPTPVPVAAPKIDLDAIREAVREEVRAELARAAEGAGAIRWKHVGTVAETESALAEAKGAGKAAILDFTGPSCVNCQKMEKSVLRLPAVAKAWNAMLAISVDTDPPHDELAQWEQDRFHTQNRPLYVRIAPDGAETRWSEVFSPDDQAALGRFQAFLGGAAGSDRGAGAGAEFWLLAVLGGLVTLLMPCTYPMIPFTVNFFAKQAAGGRSILPLAAFYALGIVACFVGLGALIAGVFHSTLSTIAGHPLTNLLIGALFIVLGLSLLGVFLLRLPSRLENALGGGRGGYLGALIMGLTFAVTAFSCTAPFAGSVLAQAVATGQWSRPLAGMAVYGATIAVPFFALAMSPGVLSRLPRAGAWMNEFKVVGGIVELAAALKFLAICDYDWHWGIVGRTVTLAAWAACGLAIAIYLLGLFRWSGDARIEEVRPPRLLIALCFLALALWLGSGLCGHNLGTLESFFPGDAAP